MKAKGSTDAKPSHAIGARGAAWLATVRMAAAWLAWAVAFAAAAQAPTYAAGGEPRAEVAILEAASGGDASTFAEALASSLAAELSGAGVAATRVGPVGDPSLGDAAIAARASASASGPRWAAIARCSIESRRLVWRLSIYDSADGALVAADAGGAFAGLSAALALGESASRVAAAFAERRLRTAAPPLLAYRLRFESPDEGAEVLLGTGPDAEPAGTLSWHGLTAPYFPLETGGPIFVTVAKDGYWPRTITVAPGAEDLPVTLPRLQTKTGGAVSLGWSFSRPFGLGLEYRLHLAPDAAFARIGNHLWFGDGSGPEAWATLHGEVSAGLGFYAFRPRDASLRFSVGAGASALGTLVHSSDTDAKYWLDALIEPLCLAIEWHAGDTAYFLEQRLRYSVGLGDGLLKRGWPGYGGLPVAFRLGVMRKWP